MNLFSFEYLIICSLIVFNIDESETKYILKSRLCADIQCKEPIGSGKTNLRYNKKDDNFVSFKADIEVQIFGKTEDEKYLDIEVNGKRGFAFATHITENRKLVPKTQLIPVEIGLNTDFVDSETKVQNESSDNNQIEETVRQTDENSVLNSTLSSEQPILYSSMNEKSAETQTMTPARDGFTVIDGTTFTDGDIDFDASPTDSSTPATATKTPTVSINLTEFKDSEVLTDDKDNQISGSENNLNDIISPEKSSQGVIQTQSQTVEKQSESVPTPKIEEIKDSNESNDKPIENVENESDLQNSDKLDTNVGVENETSTGADSQTGAGDYSEIGAGLKSEISAGEYIKAGAESETSARVDSETSSVSDTSAGAGSEISAGADSSIISPEINSSIEPNNNTSGESTSELSNDTTVPKELKNETISENVDKPSFEKQPDSNPSVSDTKTVDSSDDSKDQTTAEDDELSLEEDKEDDDDEEDDELSDEPIENVLSKESVNNSIDISNEDKKDNDLNLNETNIAKQNSTDSIETSSDPQKPDETEKLSEEQIPTQSPVYNQEMPIEPTVPPSTTDDNVIQTILNEENTVKIVESLNDKINESVDNKIVNESTSETISESSDELKVENKIEEKIESIQPLNDISNDDINNQINYNSDSNDNRIVNDLNQTLEAELNTESVVSSEAKVELPDPVPDIENPEPKIEPIDEIVDLNKVVSNDLSDVELPDPLIDSIKANIEPNIESQHIFKWMGLEGMGVTNVISDIIPEDIQLILEQFQVSAQVVVFTFIIAFNWCLMKILLSVFNSSKKETELRNMCCKAERQIYYFEAEKKKLQTEIDRETEKSKIAEERMQSAEHKVIPLEKEFNKLKNERELLIQKVSNLENELESAAEAGLEANRLLNDFLNSQKENINLNSSVDALQQQITKQSEIVAKYESTAHRKEKENRELKEKFEKMSSELERMKNLFKETEHNLQTFQTNNEELKASKSELNRNLNKLEDEYSSLQTTLEDYSHKNEELLANVEKLTEELRELKDETVLKDNKIESMNNILMKFTKSRKQDNNYNQELNDDDENEEQTDQIDAIYSEKSLTDLVNIVEMEVQLKNLTNDKCQLVSKLEDVSEQCRQLSDKINGLEVDNQNLKTERECAVQERVKAENKLEVLTDYYNKKELEFGKEIGVQHIQRRMKEEDAESMSSRLVSTEEENVSLRSQLMSMKKEIEDTERKYKSQINQLEKQVHENWILARNAERKLDESKAEATALRQTLTMSVKSPIDGFGGDASYMDDSASSISDHFGGAMPPPPPPPMPPPPPIFNPMMPPMHMPFPDDNDHQSGHWNQNMIPNMNSVPMPMPGMPPHFAQAGVLPMSAFNPIANDMNANMSYGNPQAVNYVPPMQQMGQQWDPSLTRDTYTPTSHRSTSSPHSQYNMYSQSNSHYSNQNPIMTSMSSPLTNSMSGQFHSNPMTSVISPLVNSSSPGSVNVLSEPIPSHWTQPQRPNGNISNLNYSHNNQYNESEGSSRPTSRNDRNDNPLHTSIV